MIDVEKVQAATRLLLEGLGVDLTDHNFADTPKRVAKLYKELFEPPQMNIPVFDEDYTDLVVMKGHILYTLCPHHLVPVRLKAAVAYIPNGKVIGASKLIRLIHDVNRQPLTQERLTALILCKIDQLTGHESGGAAVLLRGEHGCMQVRGVKSIGAEMITVKYSGQFQSDLEMQRRFMELCNHG